MTSQPPIAVRLEKLRFLVEELELAFELSRGAPDAWEGRMIARHVLVRARDFVAHARLLRKPLRVFGSVVKFNDLKEIYAAWFEEYFAKARDRLGAHVQDLDFLDRIEIWNDIETSKANVFVDGAREIYDVLGTFGLPGYTPLQPPPELSDPAFRAALNAFRGSRRDRGVEMSSDPLAMTRPNTVSMLNTHPIHARAGQLSMIARWIASERAELIRFATFPRIVRILRARLLSDIVSFADCLVTRPVSPSAPQAMKGLDEILQDEGHPSARLSALLSAYRFDHVLARLRPARNAFAAHLDDNEVTDLASILVLFDGLDWQGVEADFDMLNGSFRSACREVLVLAPYLTDGKTLKGVLGTAGGSAVSPYDPAAPTPGPPILPKSPLECTEIDYVQALNRWLGGDEAERDAAQTFLWQAFGANAGETFTVEHDLGAGQRLDRDVITQAHAVVLQTLLRSDGLVVFWLLELLGRQAHGYPNRAAEVVIRFTEEVPASARANALKVCRVLGDLAGWDAPRQTSYLRSWTAGVRPWPLRREATVALFKAYVRTEGLQRLNERRRMVEFDRAILPLTSKLAKIRELDVLIAMLSNFCGPLSMYRKPFEAERAELASRIEALAAGMLARQGRADRKAVVGQLLASEDLVGLVLLLSESETSAFNRGLLGMVRDGLVLAAAHDQAARHLIGCLWQGGHREAALEAAEHRALLNPTETEPQLLRLEFLAELGRELELARRETERLGADFNLSALEAARLANIRAMLASSAG